MKFLLVFWGRSRQDYLLLRSTDLYDACVFISLFRMKKGNILHGQDYAILAVVEAARAALVRPMLNKHTHCTADYCCRLECAHSVRNEGEEQSVVC